MSTTQTRMTLPRSQQLAEALRGELWPGCVRIEIAGSVRRRCSSIGDLELVAIPRYVEAPNLFPYHRLAHNPAESLKPLRVSELDRILDRLMMEDRIVRHKNGDKYKQFTLRKPDVKVDLFICDAATWAVCLLIRTGPAEFAKRFVTQKKKGGLLPDNMRIGGARTNTLYVEGEAVELAEEEDLFRAVGMKWLWPWERH